MCFTLIGFPLFKSLVEYYIIRHNMIAISKLGNVFVE